MQGALRPLTLASPHRDAATGREVSYGFAGAGVAGGVALSGLLSGAGVAEGAGSAGGVAGAASGVGAGAAGGVASAAGGVGGVAGGVVSAGGGNAFIAPPSAGASSAFLCSGRIPAGSETRTLCPNSFIVPVVCR